MPDPSAPAPASDATTVTNATYDIIAADYATRVSDPGTLAEARTRFAALVPPGGRVLDVGCGPGRDLAGLARLGLGSVGLDRSRGMLRQARQRTTRPLLLGDMRRLPVRPGLLDGLWVSASFLHLPKADGPAVLSEFRRVLRAGGVLYLGVKEGTGEGWTSDDSHGHVLPRFFAYYQAAELDERLAEAGFAVVDGWSRADRQQRWLNRLAVAGR